MTTVTRFAPSPTGFLHLGHVHSALAGWRRARESGGRFLLRLEDIDATRCRPEYARAVLEDLRWLGLDWDGAVRVQSAHLADYASVLDGMRGRGLLYPCFCTRAEVAREVAAAAAAPHGPDGPIYPGICRRLSQTERSARLDANIPHAWRLDIAAALAAAQGGLVYEEDGVGIVTCDPARFGDVVLARRDVPVSYHLCVTHDDALQGVTLVTRGQDLRAATDLQRLLQALMGWSAPAYAHHALLSDPFGRRLAKRDQAQTIRALRQAGMAPAEVLSLASTSQNEACAGRQTS
jgi:glutamyl-Q tRNA(Asp) synthetase